ncbi:MULTISPECIES: Nif3-like dinuclear metal center hexameric protein [unclassified Robiginitalea]|uniref:Nif3-like dinuclear metal center hexameric protein n=1 Tax=Robiginitalea TaxID=252306 RepID=UPI002349C753|nr:MULTISPECIES: Nif3-like dinuclear metal center hexameric protein [unclassified Robiginitalea]MDC6354661.1 Nif3-like dinuclear metal center hexameric protein [Robiginitalea sp. PM2]MDC6374657.1 Nif3-like dinuclear metal center hexameric protein [Robiginitalea sp. SP8]
MTVKEIADCLEELAPLPFAEDFDNVGLLVGDPGREVTGVLVTLDTLEAVVEEAVEKGCNLIVSFHPIVFKGLKKITGATYVERVVTKAIENRVAIYSMHTALDNVLSGVNGRICDVLGLDNRAVLIPSKGKLRKLTTYVPESGREALLQALFDAGAGQVGNYSNCSFSNTGEGTFLPGADANPTIGSRGNLHREPESQLHLTFTANREQQVLRALRENHPYEEVAYEVTALENSYQQVGMGMVGSLKQALDEKQFLDLLKSRFGTPCIRHSDFTGKKVQRVAVLGGSGAFAIGAARAAGADAYVTADIKYHEFYQAAGELLLADVGHYETEQFTKNLLHDYLTEKIPNFAISLSGTRTNPINYY